jgi:hypothetical protein
VCETQGYKPRSCRSVAQPGRALRSGRRGRRFESCHSDQSFHNSISLPGQISGQKRPLILPTRSPRLFLLHRGDAGKMDRTVSGSNSKTLKRGASPAGGHEEITDESDNPPFPVGRASNMAVQAAWTRQIDDAAASWSSGMPLPLRVQAALGSQQPPESAQLELE